jgi:hypothetical protein
MHDPWEQAGKYTKKPHAFRALGPKGVTCIDCGNLEKHPLHSQKQGANQAPTPNIDNLTSAE